MYIKKNCTVVKVSSLRNLSHRHYPFSFFSFSSFLTPGSLGPLLLARLPCPLTFAFFSWMGSPRPLLRSREQGPPPPQPASFSSSWVPRPHSQPPPLLGRLFQLL